MSQSNHSTAILIFVEDGYEDMELMYPKYRLEEAGYRVVVAGPKARQKYVGKHGYPCISDASLFDVSASDFRGLICPGGWAPDKLRRIPEVKRLTVEFSNEAKLVAAICHGGWIPISAGVYRGVGVTGSPGIKDDLVNAGAIFEDAPVVCDRHFVSSRKPDDLPAFMRAVLQVLTAAMPVAAKV
jgi:protease I